MNTVLLFKIWECQKRSKPKKIIATISIYIVVVVYIILVQSLTLLRSHKLSAVDKDDDYEYWQYL